MVILRLLPPLAFASLAALAPVPLAAQGTGAVTSQAELPRSDEVARLNEYLARLATAPQDVEALIGAGESALMLDDPRAAVGFFGRADEAAPGQGRVKAGLGRAMLGMGQNSDALRLMEEAGRLGWSDAAFLSDRGMARDLAGDQAGAQVDYLAALRSRPKDVTLLRRYAVSLGISGKVDQAEKVIEPLLYKSDRGAWRDRAFILAMNGRRDQARTITRQVMPGPLAEAIQPYMERMEMLSPAQRAAAVHLGQFPPGLVNVRVAAATPQPTASVAPATSAAPAASGSRRSARDTRLAARTSAPSPRPSAAVPSTSAPAASAPAARTAPAPTQGPPASLAVAPAPAASVASAPAASTMRQPAGPPVPPEIEYRAEPAAPPSQPAAAPAQVATAPAEPVASTPAAASAPSQPTVTVAAAEPAVAPASAPAPVAAAPASAPASAPRTLAQIMAEIEVPSAEQAAPQAAVDLAEIARLQAEARKAKRDAEAKAKRDAEAKAKKAAEEKAKAEALAEKKRLAANPSRVWVQIGTGRDKGALAFTLRAMRKQYAAQIGKRDGWTAEWGRTNRLVVGPFATLAKARDFEAAMNKAGSDAFVWQSEAGEDVAPLGGK